MSRSTCRQYAISRKANCVHSLIAFQVDVAGPLPSPALASRTVVSSNGQGAPGLSFSTKLWPATVPYRRRCRRRSGGFSTFWRSAGIARLSARLGHAFDNRSAVQCLVEYKLHCIHISFFDCKNCDRCEICAVDPAAVLTERLAYCNEPIAVCTAHRAFREWDFADRTDRVS